MTKIGGYEFKTSLIDTAFTHSSKSAENYERLEFLGDSILDFLIADILYKNNNLKEDELTRSRANIVSEENLSKVFDSLNLQKMVKLGKSLKVVTKAIKCDVLESVIATIYLESGLNACQKFITDNFNLSPDDSKDYKTKFQEFAQKNKYQFQYDFVKSEGEAHNLTFYINLIVNGMVVASASAKSKAEAEKQCAKIALEKYKG